LDVVNHDRSEAEMDEASAKRRTALLSRERAKGLAGHEKKESVARQQRKSVERGMPNQTIVGHVPKRDFGLIARLDPKRIGLPNPLVEG
jgi:hypothetical protein